MFKWFIDKIAKSVASELKIDVLIHTEQLLIKIINDNFCDDNSFTSPPDKYGCYNRNIRIALEKGIRSNYEKIIKEKIDLQTNSFIDIINSENFIDKIVARILRKQI